MRAQVEDIVRQRIRIMHAEEQHQMMLCMPELLTQGVRGAARPPWPRDCIGFPPAPY